MSLIEIEQDQTPEAVKLAKGFTLEANQHFENVRDASYDAVDRMWYRNRDANGNRALEGDEPTGIEILQAMGTNAGRVYAAATRRAQMVLAIAQDLDRMDLVDLSRIMAPYELTFAQDGSLDTWTLR